MKLFVRLNVTPNSGGRVQEVDALIVGAGPAGGECARQMAAAGKSVMLVEKAKDFSINNYSSGGAPLEILSDYQLPNELFSTTWNRFSLYSSQDANHWSAPQPKGVVL